MYSMFNGPFDIVPKPTAQVNTQTTSFDNAVFELHPSQSLNQQTGTVDWVSLNTPSPGDPLDWHYRLTQCYYVGCKTPPTNPWDGTECEYSFMTDCSAGHIISGGFQNYDNPIKWPRKAPTKGFLLENFEDSIQLGDPFYVDVNFVFEMSGTQNELAMMDDCALYGQINYIKNCTNTTDMPYIDWSGNIPTARKQPTESNNNFIPTAVIPPTLYGGAPMNILYDETPGNTNNFTVRPQYSGDLLYTFSNNNPISNSIISQIDGITNADISGATYRVPIRWRAKCIIPKPSVSPDIDFNNFDLSDNVLKPTTDSKIYLALTMFNTQSEFALNYRSFNYNIVFEDTVEGTQTIMPVAPGGTDPQYGNQKWKSSRGFKPSITIVPILQD
jgi:hypothetical protein